jgi:hypothetical protein
MLVRRLFIGTVTVDHDGWQHLRTVLRSQSDVFDCETGELMSEDERYRAVPWKTLLSDCFFALVSTTAADLATPQPNSC